MRRSLMFSTLIFGFLLSGVTARVDADYEDKRRCRDCTNCCNNNGCVSGEMQVKERTKGIVHVAELSKGDAIRGLAGAERTPGWCKVQAVYPRSIIDNVTTYDGFTEDHMVVDADTVRPYGKKGITKDTQIYTLATECDAAVNVEGQAFTPISTTFCPHELSWSEYLPLMAAIRRVTDRTGYFWYSSDAFYDNETAKVPFWTDMLHEMCTELLRCAREGRCQEFENVMVEFVHAHLSQKYLAIVERAFPNIGGDVEKSEAGTITEVVRSHGRSHTVLISAASCAMAMVLIIIVVAALVNRRRVSRKKKEIQKKPLSNLPAEKVEKVEDMKV